MNNELATIIANATAIAELAHAGQTRSDGTPYITHHLNVALKVEDRLKPIAILHDVIENTNWTLEDLAAEGMPKYVLTALEYLTHDSETPYFEYIKALKDCPDAVAVKLADIEHNLSDAPTPKQVTKYATAKKILGA